MRNIGIIALLLVLLLGRDAFAVTCAPKNASTGFFGVSVSRARYFNPQIGRFWTMDSYEGSQSDPLSLHKYLYCHADPVNRLDPSGNSDLTLIGTLKVAGIQGVIGASVSFGIDYAVHRDLKRAGKAAGWGFVIGAGAGATFHGIRAVLAARGVAAATGVTVALDSAFILQEVGTGSVIGVIDSAGVVQLFRFGPGVFRNGVEILGHADLIKAGLIVEGECQGFRVMVEGGKIVRMFASSGLKTAQEGYVLTVEKAGAVLDSLEAWGAELLF